MTNGDWIRSMTDEELSYFLISGDSSCCAHCEYFDREKADDFEGCCLDGPCGKDVAVASFKKWLSSEYVPGSVDGGEGK